MEHAIVLVPPVLKQRGLQLPHFADQAQRGGGAQEKTLPYQSFPLL